MKKVISNYLAVTVILLVTAFLSCNNEKVQLLETTTNSDGSFEKYEYDNENRITKTLHYDKEGILILSRTISYNGENFVKVVITTRFDTDSFALFEYSKSAEKIIATIKSKEIDSVKTITIDLDNNGFPARYVSMSDVASSAGVFEIQRDNLAKHSYHVTCDGVTLEGSADFKYDNKKSPLYHCKTPKWWWIVSDKGISTQNNVIEMIHSSGEKVEYEYEFDSAGYPIKCTTKGNGSEYVCEFKYKLTNACI